MSHLFSRKPQKEKRKNKGEMEETIITELKNSNQEIDECGIYDFYPSVSQNSILSSLQTSAELFNEVNTLLCHLQSPELVLFFSEETSCRDYRKFFAIIDKYHSIRSQIHATNKSAKSLLNKAMPLSKKNKEPSYIRLSENNE